jgi:uncharacterized protein YcbX
MYVQEIWRYPVKSMAGERLATTQIGISGIDGDRQVLVGGADGRVITSRTHPRLLGLKGSISEAGEAHISGHPWDSPEALSLVKEAAGPTAKVFQHDGPERFDVLPLLVATDGAIREFGHDSRRLRANLILGGVEGLSERTWPGKCLRIGNVVIGVQDLRGRCVMTTFDPDTLEQNVKVLREIVQKFDGELALNCFVVRAGRIREGDKVELLTRQECETIRS